MEKSVFPGPDHDHGRCTVGGMALAEELCRRTGQRLTPMRRQVLAVLLDGHKPMGAYDIIGAIGTTQEPPAPITIYRALDFLRENGLVHRIESRNAFIACVHNHETGAPVVFLICERCGAVGEAPSQNAAEPLMAAAREAGFVPKVPVIEIGGICRHCRT